MGQNPRWVWPLKGAEQVFPDTICGFGALRKHDVHAGVDLFCELGTEVVAVEDGEVFYIEVFTGPDAESRPSPWWNETFSLLVRGATGVVIYGECTPQVEVGDKVVAGQVIAVVDTPVLKAFGGRPMVMLHLELWTAETTKPTRWGYDPTPRDERVRPPNLLDPSSCLRGAATDPVEFTIENYKGVRFRDPSAATKASRWWVMWGGESPPEVE